MRRCSNKLVQNEKGFTLLELLISVVILSLIVGALLSAFATTTKINISSGAIVDEGYIAQDLMEEIYSLSASKKLSEIITYLVGEGFVYISDSYPDPDTGSELFTFRRNIDKYYVQILIYKGYLSDSYNKLSHIIVGIYKDSAYTHSLTKMQNYLLFDD